MTMSMKLLRGCSWRAKQPDFFSFEYEPPSNLQNNDLISDGTIRQVPTAGLAVMSGKTFIVIRDFLFCLSQKMSFLNGVECAVLTIVQSNLKKYEERFSR
jgi:hypothetical protein